MLYIALMDNQNTQNIKGWGLEEALSVYYPKMAEEVSKLLEDKKEFESQYKQNKHPFAFLNMTGVDSSIKTLKENYRKKFSSLVCRDVFIYGQMVPIKPDSKFIRIPSKVFNEAQVNWQENSLFTHNREIHNLTVLDSPVLDEPKPKNTADYPDIKPTTLVSPEKTKEKPVGRPSYIDLIYAVYVRLKDLDLIDFSMPQKAIFNQVRSEVHKTDPDLFCLDRFSGCYKNLGETTLKKALSHHIKSEKAKLKS